MTIYVALLRAVNVGGTGKMPMTELRALCESVGFTRVRTYIASGNVVFESKLSKTAVKKQLERVLETYAGKAIGILVRTGAEMKAVLAANPFTSAAPDKTVAIFLDGPPPADALSKVTGQDTEEIALGRCEIYVHYAAGIGRSKLKLAVASTGTARNMNTVATLAEWASVQ
jgi:uncharacterized protein (DUF1697 family)